MHINKEKTDNSRTRDRIEKEILTRRTQRAHARIIDFLQQYDSDREVVFEACEWYRRLGLYRQGLTLLELSEPFRRDISAGAFERKRLLWAARFLNSMGASEFALKIVENVEPQETLDWKIVGGIYLSNYRFNEAFTAFTLMRKQDPASGSYSSRLAEISYADALCGIGKARDAFECAIKTLKRSDEPLLKGICLQAAGEYLISDGRIREALEYLNQADKLIPAGDTTADRGFLLKWMGYCHGKLGSKKTALDCFRRAEKILFRSDLRPEVGLEIHRLKCELNYLSKTEHQRLYFYPGLSEFLRNKISPCDLARFGVGHSHLEIDFTRDEYRIENQWSIQIPTELVLLGQIAGTGKLGLSRTRAKALLWPEEPFAYRSMTARMNQLVARIRSHYNFEIECSDEMLRIKKSSAKSLTVVVGKRRPPSFLEDRVSFAASDFSTYYGLGKTQTASHLKRWTQLKYVERTGSARNSRYTRMAISAEKTAD